MWNISDNVLKTGLATAKNCGICGWEDPLSCPPQICTLFIITWILKFDLGTNVLFKT